MQEGNGDGNLLGGDFDDPSGSGTGEDMGHKNTCEEDEEEEPIPWVKKGRSLI
jgi:hypothetical protein